MAREHTADAAPGTSESVSSAQITPPPPVFQPERETEDPCATHAGTVHHAPDSVGALSVTDLESDASSLALAKQEYPWTGYEDDPLPDKTHYGARDFADEARSTPTSSKAGRTPAAFGGSFDALYFDAG